MDDDLQVGLDFAQQESANLGARQYHRDLFLHGLYKEFVLISNFLRAHGGEVTLCCDENYVRGLLRTFAAFNNCRVQYGGGWELTFDNTAEKLVEKTVKHPDPSAISSGADSPGSHDLAIDGIFFEIKAVAATGGKGRQALEELLEKDFSRIDANREGVRMLLLIDIGAASRALPWPANLIDLDADQATWEGEKPEDYPACDEWSLHFENVPHNPTHTVLVAWQVISINQGPNSEGPHRRVAMMITYLPEYF